MQPAETIGDRQGAPPPSMPPDRYRLLEAVGEGGAGSVFRAVDELTGGTVAVKILRDRGARSLERFASETGVLAALGHPHVVRYVAHGLTAEGFPYLVMEWLSGEHLLARLGRGPLGVDQTLELGRHVADALAAAHAHGVVHRDIKPSNLFLVGGEVSAVRVLDFGMAVPLRGPGSTTGAIVGTPGFMAPEQARGERVRIDARADVFSLGAVLYQCLTGERAFPGEHTMAVLAQLLLADAPRVRERRPEVPAAVDALVARLLAREPADRPADGAAVLAALEGLGPRGAGMLHSTPPPPPEAAITADERRFLSVIAVSPADGIQTARAAAVLEGARVDDLGDGAFLVTLSGQDRAAHTYRAVSATELAARAARCALRLRAALPEAMLALAMGRGEAGGRLPVGAVVERVAELAAAAQPGGPVVVDDVAHALLEGRFAMRDDGVSPPALLREREAMGGARRLLGRPTPYVGRDRDLRMIRDLVMETLRGDRGAQAVVVTAPAGMGKTRLRHELWRSIRADIPTLAGGVGRGDAMSAGTAFAEVASMLRNAMAVAADDLDATRAAVADWVARVTHDGAQARVRAFLGEMMGAPFPDDEVPELRAARSNTARMAAEISRAFVDFARGICAWSPVLVILEDLHWGDTASIRLFDEALRDLEDQRFVVLALARPEVQEVFPDLWSKRGVQHVRLGPLPRRAAEELSTRTLAAAGVTASPADVASIVERAGGNAFYLEELIRAYASLSASGPGPGPRRAIAELPETVLGMVTARLAALPAVPRQLLRAASVFGEVFPLRGALSLLPEADRDEAGERWVPWLVKQEILVARGDGAHAFRHALLREGSYAALTDRDRVVGHRLAGAFLAGVEGGGSAVVGEHFFRGEEWEQAFLSFTGAGDSAGRLHAHVEARHHYGRAIEALDRLPDRETTRRRRVDTVIKKVSVSYGDDPGPNLALLAGAEAIAVALPGAASPGDEDFRRLARVRFWTGRCHWYDAAYPEAVRRYREVLAAARQMGDDELAALPSGTLGRVVLAQGQAGKAVPLLEASLDPLARVESWAEWVVNAGFIGVSLALRGHAAGAIAQGERVLARAGELKDPTSESVAYTMLGGIHVFSGDPARGRSLHALAVETADRAGDRVYAYLGHGFGAWADSRLGRHDAAVAGMARARAIMAELGRRLVMADWFEAFAVESAALAGRTAEAIAAAERDVPALEAAGSTFAAGLGHRAWAVALAHDEARLDEGLSHLDTSLRLLEAGEIHVEAARTRLVMARLLRRRGDEAAAAAQIATAAPVLERAGAAHEV